MRTIKTPGYWMALGAHTNLYGGKPYVDAHCHFVVENLITYGFDSMEWRDAGWLHDAVEDTSLKIDTVREYRGEFVANLVWAVSGFGENRKARIADMHRKVAEFPKAAILKTADRIHNMESAKLLDDPGLFKMYVKEFPAFAHLVETTGTLPPEMLARLYSAAA